MARKRVLAAIALCLCGISKGALAESEVPEATPVCEDIVAAETSVYLPGTGVTFTLPPEPGESDCLQLPVPVRPPPPNAFGSVALPVKTTRLDHRWNEVRTVSLAGVDGPWTGVVQSASAADERTKLYLVNTWVNEHVTYSPDGDDDRWADAESTITSGTGDCEDIAIAKLALLQMAGVSADSMYLVLVRDVSRAIDHAVLAVSLSGEMAILDSRTDRILPSQAIADYQPVLSYAETFAWTYGYKQSSMGMIPGSFQGPSGK